MKNYENSIEKIEKHYRKKLPSIYKKWIELGYIHYESDKYLWVNDAEWLQPNEIIGTLENFFDYVKILGNLIPFAFTGGGDYWCWKTDKITNENEYCILLCPHDYNLAEVYAPSFASWFYRRALEYASIMDFEQSELVDANEFLNIWANKLIEINRKDWANDLSLIASLEPFIIELELNGMDRYGLITQDECNKRIRHQLGLEYFENEIQWIFH